MSDIAIEQCGFYLPDHARYDHLLNLPEKGDIAIRFPPGKITQLDKKSVMQCPHT